MLPNMAFMRRSYLLQGSCVQCSPLLPPACEQAAPHNPHSNQNLQLSTFSNCLAHGVVLITLVLDRTLSSNTSSWLMLPMERSSNAKLTPWPKGNRIEKAGIPQLAALSFESIHRCTKVTGKGLSSLEINVRIPPINRGTPNKGS